jgi:hypothetical protein
MAHELTEYLSSRMPARFRPHPFYSEEGDFLTYFFEGVDHYADRMDDMLTVYVSMTDDHIVGFKLKGIANLWRTLGDYSLVVFDEDNCVRLSLFLTAGLLRATEPDAFPVYQKFAQKTKGVRVRKEKFAFCV